MADCSGSEQWWSVLGSSREWSLQLILPLGSCSCTLRGRLRLHSAQGTCCSLSWAVSLLTGTRLTGEEEWRMGFSCLTAEELLAVSDLFIYLFIKNTGLSIKQLRSTCDLGFP